MPPSAIAEGRHTHTHEIGHNLGLSHSVHSQFGLTPNGLTRGVCPEVASPTAADFPPALGPMSSGPGSLIYGLTVISSSSIRTGTSIS